MEVVNFSEPKAEPRGLIYPSARALSALVVLSVALTVSIYVLISLGGLVRGAGAGLSCPDWPLCHGQLVPNEMFAGEAHPAGTPAQIFLEWFHRMIAGGVSISLLVICATVFSHSGLRARVGKFCVLALCLLTSQIVLGGLTVLGFLSPKWVVSHLLVGLGFFLVNLWMAMKLHAVRQEANGVRIQQVKSVALTKASFWAASVLFAQIFLGGLVSSNYAALACPDFPTCNGAWIPPLTGLVKFQFFHRFGALIATLTVLWYFFKLVSNRGIREQFSLRAKTSFLAIPVLLLTQLALGIGMVLMDLPLLMSVGHLAVAAAMLASVFVLRFEVSAGAK